MKQKTGFSFFPLLSLLFLLGLGLVGCNEDSLTQGFDELSQADLGKAVPSGEFDETDLQKSGNAGALYLISNAATGNEVIAFDRAADGSLSNQQSYATAGLGTGGGLGSQGAVVRYRQFLFVVNAGSNEISSFRVNGQGLTLVDVEPSAGTMPISLTVHDDRLYVLNAGGTGNIAGFSLNHQGDLSFLPGSVQPLSTDAAGGAQVSFSPSGRFLIVTEKATNAISIYPVDFSGLAGAPTTYPSVGDTPFGFDFGKRDRLIVSDAFGGAPNASAMTSYQIEPDGSIDLITGPVATNQTAACWVVVTNDSRYTYTTNTGSANVTGYRITPSGALQLLDASGVSGQTGAGPIDLSLSRNSQYLYALSAGSDSITAFAVNSDGSLTHLDEWMGLPDGAAGLAAE